MEKDIEFDDIGALTNPWPKDIQHIDLCGVIEHCRLLGIRPSELSDKEFEAFVTRRKSETDSAHVN